VASAKPQAEAATVGRAAEASRQKEVVACHRCIVKITEEKQRKCEDQRGGYRWYVL
jgi:hypothetical protein